MEHYHYQKKMRATARKWYKVHHLLFVLISAGLAILGVAGYHLWRQSQANSGPQISKVAELGKYEGAPKRNYANEKFEFKSSRQWMFSEDSSQLSNKYVYISQRNSLVDYVLTIYIGVAPANLPVAYVVPVEIINNALLPLAVSPRCSEPGTQNKVAPTKKEFQGVVYYCNNENNAQTAAAGMVGSGYSIKLKNETGKETAVSLIFEDSSGNFRPDAFQEVLRTFKLK